MPSHDPRHHLGLAHDLERLMQQADSRRGALRWLVGASGLSLCGAGALGLAACGGGGGADTTGSSSVPFDDVYGFTWGLNIIGGGREAVDASFERYFEMVQG